MCDYYRMTIWKFYKIWNNRNNMSKIILRMHYMIGGSNVYNPIWRTNFDKWKTRWITYHERETSFRRFIICYMHSRWLNRRCNIKLRLNEHKNFVILILSKRKWRSISCKIIKIDDAKKYEVIEWSASPDPILESVKENWGGVGGEPPMPNLERL